MLVEKLTNQQEKMLEKIKKYIVKHGYAPTVRELCQEMNFIEYSYCSSSFK